MPDLTDLIHDAADHARVSPGLIRELVTDELHLILADLLDQAADALTGQLIPADEPALRLAQVILVAQDLRLAGRLTGEATDLDH
ncbi:hypothetical protein [Streptomyces buecherae]|uniref:hypothetical protein n=1 Tax=Streptomyces buecherae TaxID=2763006 RepID=UPI003788354A